MKSIPQRGTNVAVYNNKSTRYAANLQIPETPDSVIAPPYKAQPTQVTDQRFYHQRWRLHRIGKRQG
jgi:hypothetical protein